MKKSKFIVFFLCILLAFATLFSGCGDNSIDYQAIINEITDVKMKANVAIILKDAYTAEKVAEGSGVIVKAEISDNAEKSSTYYVISNNHVVAIETQNRKEYIIRDYVNNVYEAELIATSSASDLCLLKITTTNVLGTVELATEMPKENEVVFCVSTPVSQLNAINVGNYQGLINPPKTQNSLSEITDFKVIRHTAKIAQGSSGGMLLNSKLQLLGINYAGLTNHETKEYAGSLAVPFQNVKEFLDSI